MKNIQDTRFVCKHCKALYTLIVIQVSSCKLTGWRERAQSQVASVAVRFARTALPCCLHRPSCILPNIALGLWLAGKCDAILRLQDSAVVSNSMGPSGVTSPLGDEKRNAPSDLHSRGDTASAETDLANLRSRQCDHSKVRKRSHATLHSVGKQHSVTRFGDSIPDCNLQRIHHAHELVPLPEL